MENITRDNTQNEGPTGLLVRVLRSEGFDCTNGGVSGRYDQFVVLGMDGPSFPSDDVPALRLVRRVVSGSEFYHLEPLDGDKRHYMAGGNFAYTSDSRFSEICRYPLSIHDRRE